MAYYINTEECVRCGCCQSNCPIGAIYDTGFEFEVKAEECIDCGRCETVCPNGSIQKA